MSAALLSTKFHIPASRTNGISRPRLTEKLLAGVNLPCSFVLLSGPAGFGKTTLLGEFVSELKRPVAWMSVDEGDNDPIRFWTYLITACQSIQRGVGESGLALLQSPQPLPDETIPTLLINDLVKLKNDLVLVLDDYHEIHNPSIHTALSFLLDHLPEKLHLVFSTRVDPPWPLARFRVRNQLIEIRAVDLRFTTEETAAFLNQVMSLNLSAENVSALEARTEGSKVGIGYVMNRAYQGKGRMTESARTIINWALQQPTIYRVYATTDVENIASQRVMEKAGMQREGLLKKYIVHPNISDEPRDSYMYAIVK